MIPGKFNVYIIYHINFLFMYLYEPFSAFYVFLNW